MLKLNTKITYLHDLFYQKNYNFLQSQKKFLQFTHKVKEFKEHLVK